MFVLNTFKKYGQANIKDEKFLTLVGSVASIFGGIRFVWSQLVDRYSFKLSYSIVLAINLIFGATIVLVSKQRYLYMIWVTFILWAWGAHFALAPTICAKLFGKHAPMMFAVVFSSGAFALIISSFLVKFFLASIGYATFYYIGTGMSAAAALLLIFFKEEKVC